MRHVRKHLTYANILSSIALFLVLGGGTAVALNGANTVFSDDIVNHQVKSDDLAKLSFTAVKPNPQTGSDPCQSGAVGIFCGLVGGSGYRGWENLGQGYGNVAYARDGLGIVHLQGVMKDNSAAPGPQETWFLPPGYRPAATRHFAVAYGQTGSPNYSLSTVRVLTNGGVQFSGNQPGAGTFGYEGVSLDGVEFNAK
jgi:hypothetical protein